MEWIKLIHRKTDARENGMDSIHSNTKTGVLSTEEQKYFQKLPQKLTINQKLGDSFQ